MKKIYKLFIPAFIAVAVLASCEDRNMEDVSNAKDGIKVEKKSYLPKKSTIQLPPNG